MIIIRYQWLLEHQKLDEEIQFLKWDIRKSEIELERWLDPDDLGKVRITNESKSAKLEENIQAKKDLLKEKEKAMDALMMMINKFKGLDQNILRLKYIDGMTIECIAEALNYSSSHIYKRHAELVKTIKFIDDWEKS